MKFVTEILFSNNLSGSPIGGEDSCLQRIKFLTYAIPYPGTMMVKFCYAPITHGAVL